MSEVNVLIEREDGALFVIDDTTWRIPSDGLSGWHSTYTDISMYDNLSGDGSVITAQKVKSADRTITVEARESSASDLLRTIAERFFVPHKQYSVLMTYMGRTRRFDGYQAMFTLSEGNIHNPISFSWTMTCESPYAKKADSELGKIIYDYGSGMPYMSLGSKTEANGRYLSDGFVTGVYDYPVVRSNPILGEKCRIVRNDGDIDVKPRFLIHPTDPVKNSNEHHMRVRIVKAYGNGESIETQDDSLDIDVIIPSFREDSWVIIDLNKRPFAVEMVNGDPTDGSAKRNKIRYVLYDDSMIMNPYVGQGDTTFLLSIDTGWGYGGIDHYDKAYVEIDELYTGV